MSSAILAHTASVPEAPFSLDVSALALLDRLVLDTRSASDAAIQGDIDSLQGLLDARDAMLASLGEIAAILANRNGPFNARASVAEATRLELIAQANELQRANVKLMQAVSRESARLAASIATLDRGDTIEFAYRAAKAERTANLDLLR
ncbi:MAG: hypothetical protein JWM95_4947 [Gemmatimonadetes bacterium]|nr:hypothetical protein [Gemmatimonadota bacterium]